MSAIVSPESSILEGLESLNIRDRVPMSRTVYLQIERCNISCSGVDPAIFEANVRMLLTMIPSYKQKEVMSRSKEYNNEVEEFVFQNYCNIQLGSTSKPLMSKDRHGIRHIVKRDEAENIDWEDPNILSPQFVKSVDTDYEELYKVIINCLESANITWRVEGKTVEMGKINKTEITDAVLNDIAQLVGYRISEYRKIPQYKDLTYAKVAAALKHGVPSTPTYELEGDPWPE